LGSKLAKSTNSPQMIRSLICGGTRGNDDWVATGCVSVDTEVRLVGSRLDECGCLCQLHCSTRGWLARNYGQVLAGKTCRLLRDY